MELKSRIPKLKNPNDNVLPFNLTTAIAKRQRQPLSELRLVDEDDVIVFDGISVAGIDLSSPSSSSSASRSRIGYASEICRSWEDLGLCRYGSSCQFAHGKEEIRSPHFPIKKFFVAGMYKPYPCIPKNRFAYQVLPKATPPVQFHMVSPINAEQLWASPSLITPTKTECMSPSPSAKSDYIRKNLITEFDPTDMSPSPSDKSDHSGKSEHASKTTYSSAKPPRPPATSSKTKNTNKNTLASSSKIPEKGKYPNSPPKPEGTCNFPVFATIISQIWSPLDDNIQASLPSQPDRKPSREEINAHIDGILCGSTMKRRLPVFTQICPHS